MRVYPEAVNLYLADPAGGLKAKTSRVVYGNLLRMLGGEVEAHTEASLVEFLNSRDITQATRIAYITRLQGFFRWAHWKRLVDTDPSTHLKRYFPGKPQATRRHHWLTETEVKKVLAEPEPRDPLQLRDLVALRLGFTMGLRREEIAGLTWPQLDLENQQAHLSVTKGEKLATVYIPEATVQVLRTWQQAPGPVLVSFRYDFRNQTTEANWGKPINGHVVGDIARTYSHKTGIPFRAHDMRRTFAGLMYDKVGIEGTSKALRHSNLGTTQRYLETRQDAAFQAMKKAGLEL